MTEEGWSWEFLKRQSNNEGHGLLMHHLRGHQGAEVGTSVEEMNPPPPGMVLFWNPGQ